jgi:hypothetical protein
MKMNCSYATELKRRGRKGTGILTGVDAEEEEEELGRKQLRREL